MRSDVIFAILAMALATYLTRISGILIGRHLPRSGRFKQALDALPPAVLTAVVAPAILSGPAEIIAGITTLITAFRFSLFPSMLIGVFTVVLCRSVMGWV